jgi:AMIN domain
LRRFSSQVVLFALALLGPGTFESVAQASFPPANLTPADEGRLPTALVRSVRVIPGPQGASIEILATRPLTPTITTVNNPLRLVVDLPKSLVASRKRISYRDPQVLGVRVDQFQLDPPTVRLVIDLDKEAGTSWDAAGNRLMIRLHPPGPAAAEASVPATFSQGTAPASSGGSAVSGDLMLAGSRVATGSSVTAGTDTAILHMARGGEIRICPGTTVSVASSLNGRDVMLGMNTGALEAHYRLDASSDSVLTPDFRILFAGPGEFHYAVSTDSRGNTCVRTLPGNSASAVVSESMGDGVYQVRPSEQVVFRSGHLASSDTNVPTDCGCPPAAVQVMRASTAANQEYPDEAVPGSAP